MQNSYGAPQNYPYLLNVFTFLYVTATDSITYWEVAVPTHNAKWEESDAKFSTFFYLRHAFWIGLACVKSGASNHQL